MLAHRVALRQRKRARLGVIFGGLGFLDSGSKPTSAPGVIADPVHGTLRERDLFRRLSCQADTRHHRALEASTDYRFGPMKVSARIVFFERRYADAERRQFPHWLRMRCWR